MQSEETKNDMHGLLTKLLAIENGTNNSRKYIIFILILYFGKQKKGVFVFKANVSRLARKSFRKIWRMRNQLYILTELVLGPSFSSCGWGCANNLTSSRLKMYITYLFINTICYLNSSQLFSLFTLVSLSSFLVSLSRVPLPAPVQAPTSSFSLLLFTLYIRESRDETAIGETR